MHDGQRHGRFGRARLHGMHDQRQYRERTGELPAPYEFRDRGPHRVGLRASLSSVACISASMSIEYLR